MVPLAHARDELASQPVGNWARSGGEQQPAERSGVAGGLGVAGDDEDGGTCRRNPTSPQQSRDQLMKPLLEQDTREKDGPMKTSLIP